MNRKNILLLGDSIMYGAMGVYGYGYYVQQKMSNIASVQLPVDNCQDAPYLLFFFDELVEEKNDVFDVIHWNNGLWDVLHFAGNPNPHTPLSKYSYVIHEIFMLLKSRYPSAKICFATTTAVPERCKNNMSFRKNSEIEMFNKAAVDILDGKVDYVNDLYLYSTNIGNEYRAADGLHYSARGSEMLAEYVQSYLRKILACNI